MENGGKLAQRKLMVYFLPSGGGTGKRWVPARRQPAEAGPAAGWVTGQRLPKPDAIDGPGEGAFRETKIGISHFCL